MISHHRELIRDSLTDPVAPGIFLVWAKAMKIDVPQTLDSKVGARRAFTTVSTQQLEECGRATEKLQRSLQQRIERIEELQARLRSQVQQASAQPGSDDDSDEPASRPRSKRTTDERDAALQTAANDLARRWKRESKR
jgi:hypothetical protein